MRSPKSNTHRPTPRLHTIHPPFRLHPIACLALYSLSPSLYLVLLRLRSPVVLTKSVSFRTISPSFVSASTIFGPPSESPFFGLACSSACSQCVCSSYVCSPTRVPLRISCTASYWIRAASLILTLYHFFPIYPASPSPRARRVSFASSL